jgi:RNA polymerase sigma-70 factor (ECF subfamily)
MPSRGRRGPEPAATHAPSAEAAAAQAAAGQAPAGQAGRGQVAAEQVAAEQVAAEQVGAEQVAGGRVAATEAVLLGRARAGDVAAFEQLSAVYADRLFMLLLRLLGDAGEAEDVAQEVMLRAWQGITRFQGRSSYFTWLYRIAVNEANRALDRRARRPPGGPIGASELDLPTSSADDPSHRAESSELRLALREALAQLPPAQRTAIVLRDVEGLSTQEAAEIAGVGQAAFKSRLHQARLRVRAAIGDEILLGPAG